MSDTPSGPESSAGEVVEVVLSGPGKNALSSALMARTIMALKRAGDRPVLLTGDGDAFSAGLDLAEVASFDSDGMLRFLEIFERLLDTLYGYPGPTVALVNGHAIAGGCLLALCCDYRVIRSDPGIRVGLNEVALGVCFPPKIRRLVQRRVPDRFVDTVVLGAGLFDPTESVRLGLVDEFADDAEEPARRWLARLSSHPRPVYSSTKADFRGALAVAPQEQRRFVDEQLSSWTSPEFKAKLQAFLRHS